MKYQQDKIIKSDFEELITKQATEKEIANYFNVSTDTIKRFCKNTYNENFQTVYNIFKNKGFISLRKKAFEMALSGNTTMMIFLLKNYLGFTDKAEQTTEEKVIIINDLPNEDI